MLQTLKTLFSHLAGPTEEESSAEAIHQLQLSTAVLLVEVIRAEPTMDAPERSAIVQALGKRFQMSSDELSDLIEMAQDTAKTAYDYQRFTSLMNERYSQAQKIEVVESMWTVAYADAHLDANENHVISKVAGLLHVTHGEYIGAKMRAKEAAAIA
ncbi:hypothetical protein LPB72_00755 [Hydrogenophaga crassostreae]|uniref:Co-chaperone DjlA N-terminal domain-containing protein n=1 Tax=Hydrogenophaga crassostreae TaxID=1763535 RepID=A0A162W5N3_9BURK|nr:TerB family tellurite resistance protein [Hydrogenophaga crassostreae]AOW13959.1 hypothetical protein LPB072_15060 [Hydrogenophaga crassostreae]OAD44076.1 hypothetical protein LPB72_00755 [Hydrogenophaga crassostreae]